MPTAITTRPPADLAQLEDLSRRAEASARNAKAENTRRAYRADWAHFTTWCIAAGLAPLPALPQTVAIYLEALSDTAKISTMRRRLVAISQAHQAAQLDPPTTSILVREVLKGIARRKASEGEHTTQKAPTVTEDIRSMVATLAPTALGTRDRALLLIGFAGAFRRAELVSLDVGDIRFTRSGLVVRLRRSKTDQEGEGRSVGIPFGSQPATCPVKALRAWLKVAGITDGPIFRPITRHGHIAAERLSAGAVATIVKRSAQAAGLEPAQYAGHSLRSGLATSAAAAGVSERAIMNQTGHKSVVVARRYIREGSLFRDNAAAAVGL